MLLSNPLNPDPRVEKEATTLVKAGHNVTVIAWNREKYEKYEDRDFKIVRIGPGARYGTMDVVLKLPLFYLHALFQAFRMDFDVVHAHDLDTAPLGFIISLIKNVPLIYDSHESYPDMIAREVPPIIKKIIEKLDIFISKHSTAVITVGNRLASRFKKFGARKVIIIGNWKERVATQSNNHGKFVISYVGVLTWDRHVEDMIKAFCNDERFEILVGGYKGREIEVKTLCNKCSNCKFLGKVDPKKIPEIYKNSDAIYYSLDPSIPNNYYSVPNSLFMALATGTPMITLDYGEIGEIVRKYKCGVVFNSQTPEEIKKAALNLMKMDLKENIERAYSDFNWNIAKNRLINLYKDIEKSSNQEGKI
ncbi:glycosyltransferase [Aciduliprofundum sp. MAR08-339]|nr:glycosyltransferase [Aciduliprofundum sp. MAR08-339]